MCDTRLMSLRKCVGRGERREERGERGRYLLSVHGRQPAATPAAVEKDDHYLPRSLASLTTHIV